MHSCKGVKMNKQEIFDEVVTFILNQGKPSRTEDGIKCLYRSPDGCKCAFGALISDDEYVPEMEYNMANEVIARFNLSRFYGHEYFIRELQKAHDNANVFNFVHDFKTNVKKIASLYNLNTLCLEKLI